VLQERLGSGYRIIPEGMNGRTTVFDDPVEEGRNGLAHLVPCLASHHPLDAVIVMLGTNDTKYRFGLLASDIALGLRRVVMKILGGSFGVGNGAPKVGIVAPVPLHPDLIDGPFTAAYAASRQLAASYEAVARELGCPFLDAGEYVSCPMPDGIHLDAAAHRVLGVALADWVEAQLLPRG
jgi:lysophospholipase L1-like esterase